MGIFANAFKSNGENNGGAVFFRIVLFDCFASGECLLFSSHGRLRIFRNEKIIEVPPSPISLFE